MTDIVGRWKVSEVMGRDPETMDIVWKDIDAYLAENDDDSAFLAKSVLEFTDDGQMRTVFRFGEDMRAAVEAEEMEIIDGNWAVLEKKPYELREDGIYYDSGAKGMIFDEPIDPWQKLEVSDDGVLELFTFRYVRM